MAPQALLNGVLEVRSQVMNEGVCVNSKSEHVPDSHPYLSRGDVEVALEVPKQGEILVIDLL
eukprot:CAMPEP_0203908084 /NCGR_PEP_ID=MMETSP0359-20131031/49511_1 /ASSEMBLY_ACC=CAM_ASM_000338 /TAXON_ID=268821 /ORGANISM="Scrippsiella Hangoei, Strain SHTV-5" /LENGTH=61 /DNA_ID=CAMNT_0050833013 /DNA_START=150 /DNA_END=332 /DNA_ORIENTATION=+